jgi:radical SAM/Cys-rich protein
LEAEYRRVLAADFGVVFTSLYALANMPIQRFATWLEAQGQLAPYQALLQARHRPENLSDVMCRSLISVDWQGWLFDCDFNQQLGLATAGGRPRPHLRALLEWDPEDNPVVVADHCFGCTAGGGSSCGGALGSV